VLYEKAFRDYFSKVQLFTYKDAERFLRSMGASEAYVKLFVHNQVKRHGLRRVGRGRYTFTDNDAVIGFAFSPFYYGMEYALTIHGLWAQMTNPVVITSTTAVPGQREVMGSRILLRRISKRMFFGVEQARYNSLFVPVSDPEKTLIDFVYYRVNLNDDDLRSLVGACDRKRLERYARRCGPRVRKGLERILKQVKNAYVA
jgi:predicted transcriptional regulator of viral defense system